ncbi:J domain-containing protein [Hydrogenophaga sp.]|uniref:J domain-containing protein n=1 Tax=Hydrogenophaga sp. TaxID=1904254 RepID=UPI002FC6B201
MTPPNWSRLMPALLDFERAPGRYRVALREPRPLFEHIASVMLLAAGRPVAGLPATPTIGPELHRAARFFVRTVMLRPGSDPFTLLGLRPGFEPAQLRHHYRLMIRLTHPDFEVAGERWPADAATRINLAHDLLSSAQQRADGTLSPTALAGGSMRPRPLLPRPAPSREKAGVRGWSARARLALASTGALFMAGAYLLMGPRGHEGSLSVRRVSPDGKPASTPPGTETPEREGPPP